MLTLCAITLVIASSGPEAVGPGIGKPGSVNIVARNFLVHSTQSRIDTPPCVAGEQIYVSTRSGELRALKMIAAKVESQKPELSAPHANLRISPGAIA